MRDKVILDLDFNQGVIWISDQETGEPITEIDVIDTNKDITKLNKKISNLFSLYYFVTRYNCFFDKEKFLKEKIFY